jgi:hypothetical protein
MTEWRVIVLVVSASVLAGCQTASLEDAAPRGAVVASQQLPPPAQPGSIVPADGLAGEETAAASRLAEPENAVTPPVQVRDETVDLSGRTTRDGFTNINIFPESAAPTLTAAEKEALLLRLRAAQAKARGASVSTATDAAEIARLRKLARQHGIDAIKEIEGE